MTPPEPGDVLVPENIPDEIKRWRTPTGSCLTSRCGRCSGWQTRLWEPGRAGRALCSEGRCSGRSWPGASDCRALTGTARTEAPLSSRYIRGWTETVNYSKHYPRYCLHRTTTSESVLKVIVLLKTPFILCQLIGGNLKLKLVSSLSFFTILLPSPVGASLPHICGAFIRHEDPVLFWISESILKLSTLALNIRVTLVKPIKC